MKDPAVGGIIATLIVTGLFIVAEVVVLLLARYRK
jgi:hypothetical protein